MSELARALPQLTGIQGSTNLSAGFNDSGSLGWGMPLLVPAIPAVVNSSPLMAAGLNGYMMVVDLAAATAGLLIVGIDILRPDLTSWGNPNLTLDTPVGTGAGGTVVIQLGSLGRTPSGLPSDAQGWASLLFRFTLGHDTAPMVINALRLWSLGRP